MHQNTPQKTDVSSGSEARDPGEPWHADAVERSEVPTGATTAGGPSLVTAPVHVRPYYPAADVSSPSSLFFVSTSKMMRSALPLRPLRFAVQRRGMASAARDALLKESPDDVVITVSGQSGGPSERGAGELLTANEVVG